MNVANAPQGGLNHATNRQIKKLIDFLIGQKEKVCQPITATVSQWEFGASVNYTDNSGIHQVEYFCLPPVVGRFDEATYNEIVRHINLNIDILKKPPR